MPQFKFKAKTEKSIQEITDAIEQTQILKKQERLTYGRWDFAVFGPSGKRQTILRVGYAENATIHRVPAYVASLAEPGWMNLPGVPIEEFISEDVPEKYRGLEIIQIDPLRPLKISENRKYPGIAKAADQISREFEDQNIAVIQSPDEGDWVLSVIKYLNECDQAFPDPIVQSLNSFRNSTRGNTPSNLIH